MTTAGPLSEKSELEVSATELDANKLIVQRPVSTFFLKAGQNMDLDSYLCVRAGDILVVDRGLEPKNGSIAIVAEPGRFILRRIHYRSGRILAFTGKGRLAGEVNIEQRSWIWGVVTCFIHSLDAR